MGALQHSNARSQQASEIASRRNRDALQRFATEEAPAPTHLVLVPEVDDTDDVAQVDHATRPWTEQETQHISALASLTYEVARRSARHKGVINSVMDADDLAQDSVEALLRQNRRDGRVLERNGGYVRSIVSGRVARFHQDVRRGGDGLTRRGSGDHAAWKEFVTERDTLLQHLQRDLTGPEVTALAARIAARHPGTASTFHLTAERPVYADAPRESEDGSSGDSWGALAAPTAASPESEVEQAWEEKVAESSDAYDAVITANENGSDERAMQWSALLEVGEITPPLRHHLTSTQASQVRQTSLGVKDGKAAKSLTDAQRNDRVLDALRSFHQGEDTQQIEALFTALGAVDNTHREDLADYLGRRPAMAYQMLDVALTSSTRRRATTD